MRRSADDDIIADPLGYAFAIVPAGMPCDDVARNLLAAGFEDDRVRIFTGRDEAEEQIDAGGEHHHLWARWVRLTDAIGMHQSDAEAYEQAASDGRCVVAVYAPSEEERDRALNILRTHGAGTIRHYGSGGGRHIFDEP